MIDQLSRIIVDDRTNVIMCSAIVLFMLGQLLRFWWQLRPIRLDLVGGIARLRAFKGQSAFTDGFEMLHKWVQDSCPRLTHSWIEFTDSLIFPDPESPNRVVRSGREAAMYFNDGSIIVPNFNASYFAGLANKLVGFGILGTFIGLAAGIGLSSTALTQDDIQKVKEGLVPLLQGASLAFWTSICGLGSSIVFSWIQRNAFDQLNRDLEEWNSQIDRLVKTVTVEQIAEDQLQELRNQTAALRTFNTDLAISVARALDQTMDQRLGPKLDELFQVLDRIREDRGESNNQVLQDMVREFRAALSQSTGNQFGQMADILERLNKTLSASASSMSGAQGQLEESAAKMALEMESALRQGASSMAKDIEAVRSATASAMELMQRMDKLSGSLEQSRAGFQAVTTQLASAAQAIAQTAKAMDSATAHQSAAAAQAAQAAQSIASSEESVQRSWAEYQQRFDGLDKALGGTFQELQTGLDGYTQRVKEFSKELDQHFAKSIGDLSGAVSEMSGAIEDFQDAVKVNRS